MLRHSEPSFTRRSLLEADAAHPISANQIEWLAAQSNSFDALVVAHLIFFRIASSTTRFMPATPRVPTVPHLI
jgi:hypothetical protein